ncbi:MAG TPA: hypothetical protein VFU21_00080 [Kofleriaceae bacterium]|nr:hypothetical protein [Kofleriaceae bacterium]
MGRAALVCLVLALSCADDEVASPAGDAGASCRAEFGEAPVYRDCGAAGDACAFHTAGAYRTCGVVCDQLGGTCEASYGTENGCDRATPDLGCDHPASEIICVCLP